MAYRTAMRSAFGPMGQQARGMATEKQILMRIVATKNISKITKSMKMVSASKMRNDQARLEIAKPFVSFASTTCPDPVLVDGLDTTSFPQKNLIIPITSDRGLCGGVNSFITRAVRKMMASLHSQGKQANLLVIGEKGRAQLRRAFPEQIVSVVSEVGVPANFATASAIASLILQHEVDAVHIMYNNFKSAISFEPNLKTILPSIDPNSPTLLPFELEPERDADSVKNMHEFTLAAQLYHSMLDNATSEQSSRMNAMENASKNAGEMIEKLTLQYNRARQARITTELIEIISGASALGK